MTDIFSEIEEEPRRDKYNALLRRYGMWVGGVALALILAAGLHQLAWEPWRQARVHAAANAYDAAMAMQAAGRTQEAQDALAEIAAGGRGGYSALALMQQGEIALAAGDLTGAASYYEQAADLAGDGALAGLARIKALYVLADTAAYDQILARAEPLAAADSPYQFSARELIAAAALRAGQADRARREYQFLQLAPETPPGVRARAAEGLAAADRARSLSAPEASAPEASAPEPAADADADADTPAAPAETVSEDSPA